MTAVMVKSNEVPRKPGVYLLELWKAAIPQVLRDKARIKFWAGVIPRSHESKLSGLTNSCQDGLSWIKLKKITPDNWYFTMSLPVPADQTHLTHPKYRADIDGLRAIAVLAVVGFHAFPSWVQGGFIGVDIFFVISGFLITSIIFENLKRGSFSFVEFYSRRIKRIFPALLVVLTACFAFGWFVLFPDEYKQLGKHIAGGAGFVANFVLWNENGYFDNAAESKPLLHLWTLGIEEQFYIIWPIVLWFAWKQRLNPLTITVAVAATSFFLNIKNIHSDTVATFYSPQTRFWELMIGSILAYVTLYKQNVIASFKYNFGVWLSKVVREISPDTIGTTLRNFQSLFGAVLICAGILIIKKEYLYPGWWAVLPTFGSLLMISSGPHAWINREILSRRILVRIGLISYPLYLWHWPLLSFARILEGDTPSRGIRMAAVVISIVLAWLTYSLLEKPVRLGKKSKVKPIVLVVLMVVAGYVGYNTYKRDGLLFRSIVNDTLKSGEDGGDRGVSINDCGLSEENKKLFQSCMRDSRQTPKYALFGDSKAGSIYSGLVRTSNENGRWLFIGSTKNINGKYYSPVIISKNPIYDVHQPLTEIALKAIAKNEGIKKVVMVVATRNLFKLKSDSSIKDLSSSKNYGAALEGLTNTINLLTKAKKKVVIVVDNPTFPYPEDCLPRITSIDFINEFLPKYNHRCLMKISQQLESTEQYRKLLNQIELNYPESVKIFDTTKYLCDIKNGVCLPSKNGRSLYSHTDHISDYAAGLIGVGLNKFLQSY